MVSGSPPHWTFLTNYAQVLMCIAHDPGIRIREIGDLVGITERAAHRIVAELVSAGYVTRQRDGRRNSYSINAELSLPDQIARERNIGDLLDVLVGAPPGAEARWLLDSRRRRADD
jgi:hypothetical protein